MPALSACGRGESGGETSPSAERSPATQKWIEDLLDPATGALLGEQKENYTRAVLPDYQALREQVEKAKTPALRTEDIRALADALLESYGMICYLLPDGREVLSLYSGITDVPQDYERAYTALQDFYLRALSLNRVLSEVLLALTPEAYRFTPEQIYGTEALALMESSGAPESLYLALETKLPPEEALLAVRAGQAACVELFCLDLPDARKVWQTEQRPDMGVTVRIRRFGTGCERVLPDAWSEEGLALWRSFQAVRGVDTEYPALVKYLIVPAPSLVGVKTPDGVELIAHDRAYAERELGIQYGVRPDPEDSDREEFFRLLADKLWLMIEENAGTDVRLPVYRDPESRETVGGVSLRWAVAEPDAPETGEAASKMLDALFLLRAQAAASAYNYALALLA